MPKHPLNDDDYTGNDEQITDLKDLVSDLLKALETILGNMQEMGYSVANETLARAAIAKAKGE